jgi:hypothetical protein
MVCRRRRLRGRFGSSNDERSFFLKVAKAFYGFLPILSATLMTSLVAGHVRLRRSRRACAARSTAFNRFSSSSAGNIALISLSGHLGTTSKNGQRLLNSNGRVFTIHPK